MSSISLEKDKTLESYLAKSQPLETDILAITFHFGNLVAKSQLEEIKHYRLEINKKFEGDALFEAKGYEAVINGLADFYLTNYESAVHHLNIGLLKTQSDDLKGLSHMLLGATSRSQGKIDVAVNHLTKAENLLKNTIHFKEYYTYVFYQLGEIYLGISEYDFAFEFYNKGLNVSLRSPLPTVEFRLQNGLGNCLLEMNRPKQAEETLLKATHIQGISIAEKSRGLCDLGKLYLKQGKLEDAGSALEESLELRKNAGLEDAASTSMIELSRLYLLQDKPQDSLSILNQALVISEKFSSESKRMSIEHLLAETHYQLSDWKLAAESYKTSHASSTEILAKREHSIFKLKNTQIEEQRKELASNNERLTATLEEIAQL